MDQSTRLRMRRGHLNHATHCTCGKTAHGNGGRAAHRRMHLRKGDGHFGLTPDALAALIARNEYPCAVPPSREYLQQIVAEDLAERLARG